VRAKRRVRTWHLIPSSPPVRRRGRSTTESERRDRKHPDIACSPTLLSVLLEGLTSSSLLFVVELDAATHRRDRSRLPHFTPTTVFTTTILALYYQIYYYYYYCYYYITTTTILPLLCSKTCTRCPGEQRPFIREAGRVRGVRRKLSETPKGTNSYKAMLPGVYTYSTASYRKSIPRTIGLTAILFFFFFFFSLFCHEEIVRYL